jgi:hypothetical protein
MNFYVKKTCKKHQTQPIPSTRIIPNLGDEYLIFSASRDLETISIILLLLPQIMINGSKF